MAWTFPVITWLSLCLEGFLRGAWKQLCFSLLFLLDSELKENMGEGTQIAIPISDLQSSLHFPVFEQRALCPALLSISGGSTLGREAVLCWKLIATCCSSSMIRAIVLRASVFFFPLCISDAVSRWTTPWFSGLLIGKKLSAVLDCRFAARVLEIRPLRVKSV